MVGERGKWEGRGKGRGRGVGERVGEGEKGEGEVRNTLGASRQYTAHLIFEIVFTTYDSHSSQ